MILNMMIIFVFDFEYNIVGLIALLYLTTSFIFKKSVLRFKILLYFFFPILIYLNLLIYSFNYLFIEN